ncbi:IS110 family transposase [Pseudomonas sp. DTU12.3]|uniref:Transposase n=3 Tax=Pseudomonas helmanticensis TaxID=1471381 RepID=A0ACD2U0S8_9PSED|nr:MULTISPECIES: transposase [Pseudomonas]QAX83156.1 IS110 family transposase [Pseudomonas sp. DTU12.3]QAX85385.1 IS110 family transposase [Pseudomonas sp. DTU12.3]QAX85386.1 IS110 family transposase [Pseudomonas sp. DTU12.3]QAX85617.1 IS110 family transposase [Pseudomonas sp. DTU12.3]QAX86333.1 IS110 family transposase [Pseudomonas sp. DTU12.3]
MAMPVSVVKPIVGVDVAKNELVIYQAELDLLETISNDKTAIKKWLKALPAPVDLAIESTNIYHLAFADLAHEAGCTIYMVDGYALSHYRIGVKVRAKTDALDAKLLARYLKNEYEELHPWIPPSPLYRRLLSLFRRRAALVQARVGLVQSWANEPLLKSAFAEQVASMQRLETLVEKMINDQLKEAGLLADLKRCTKVEGIGFLTGARLIATFQRGDFKNADAFIAFLGMDLRVSQSGQKDGRRSLTKRGDPEARRLLHNAAMSASRTPAWKSFYEEQRNRGFSTTQALVILARKLARVVFALLKGQSEYQPKGG